MEDIVEKIKSLKPNLKKTSLDTYLYQLKNLNDRKPLTSLEFTKDTEKIFEMINDKSLITKRNYLAALMVATKSQDFTEAYEIYRKELRSYNEDYDKFIEEHQKTPVQQKNWTTLEELKNLQIEKRKQINKLGLYDKETLIPAERKLFTDYLIISLYTLIPPVRLDYANMKIIKNRQDDDRKTNYLLDESPKNKYFIFNDFKNVRTRGTAEFKIPPNLNKIIKKWLTINKTDDFLVNFKDKPYNTNTFGKIIPRVFANDGRKPSLNVIRHAWASANVDLNKRKQLQNLADAMLHTPSLQVAYSKYES